MNGISDATSASLLDEIDRATPFGADGKLPEDVRRRLAGLADTERGRAITILLRHAAGIRGGAVVVAAGEIEALMDAGPIDRLAPGLGARSLAETHLELGKDRGQRALSELIVRLLRTLDPGQVFGGLGIDARSMAVRAELSRLLAEPAAANGGQRSEPPDPSRGIDFDRFDPAPANGGKGAEPQSRPPEMAGGVGAEPPTGSSPPGSRPSGRTETIRAYGLLACDETVLIGRPFDLTVGLSPAPSVGVAGSPLRLPKPDAIGYSLDVQLFADGFDLAPGQDWRHALRVSAADPFPTVELLMTPRPCVEPRTSRSISATFSIGGETLGAATRLLEVVDDLADLGAASPTGPATGANISSPTGDPPADLTITIMKGVERGVLVWSVESPHPDVALPGGPPPTSDVGDDPEAFAKEIIQQIYAQGNRRGILELLEGIGKAVQRHIPPAVQEVIHAVGVAVAPRPPDILLLTEDPYVPWELAWLDEKFDPQGLYYLGAQANVGRWVFDGGVTGPQPPRRVDASSMAVVWGVYDQTSTLPRLVAAEDEAKEIVRTYGAASVNALNDPVIDLLGGKPPADVLHFAVHGRFNPDNVQQGIFMLDGVPINDLIIGGSDLTARMPFVFLNACQVGTASAQLGSYGGTAQAFLQAGASAVVAPLWSINDVIARKIAVDFYRQAFAHPPKRRRRPDSGDGKASASVGARGAAPAGAAAPDDVSRPPAVAALLREARAGLIRDAAARSSTYLAYQFYGHPSLRLSWSAGSAGGRPRTARTKRPRSRPKPEETMNG